MADKEKTSPLEELELLEGKIGTIQELVKAAKNKSLAGNAITSEELGMLTEKVSNLHDVLGKRQDVGH